MSTPKDPDPPPIPSPGLFEGLTISSSSSPGNNKSSHREVSTGSTSSDMMFQGLTIKGSHDQNDGTNDDNRENNESTPVVSNRQVVQATTHATTSTTTTGGEEGPTPPQLSLPVDSSVNNNNNTEGTAAASPVTDKLLGMLNEQQQQTKQEGAPVQNEIPAEEAAAPEPPLPEQEAEAPAPASSSFFSGWWSSAPAPAPPAPSLYLAAASGQPKSPRKESAAARVVEVQTAAPTLPSEEAKRDDDDDVPAPPSGELLAAVSAAASASAATSRPAVSAPAPDPPAEVEEGYDVVEPKAAPAEEKEEGPVVVAPDAPDAPEPPQTTMDEAVVESEEQQQQSDDIVHVTASSSTDEGMIHVSSEVETGVAAAAVEETVGEVLDDTVQKAMEEAEKALASSAATSDAEDEDDEDCGNTNQAILEIPDDAFEDDDDDDTNAGPPAEVVFDPDETMVSATEGDSSMLLTMPEDEAAAAAAAAETEAAGGGEAAEAAQQSTAEQVAEDSPAAAGEEGEKVEEEIVSLTRKEMDEKDKKALDDAFETHLSTTVPQPAAVAPAAATETMPAEPPSTDASDLQTPEKKKKKRQDPPTVVTDFTPLPRMRGLGVVHPDTPIPNADVCLRLLRKFARKTRPRIVTTYGGSKPLSLYGYFFNSKPDDPTYVPYKVLMDILFEDGDRHPIDEELQDESEAESIVHGIMGVYSGDTMDRARRALAAFCFIFSSWGHASAHLFDLKDVKTRESFSDLLAAVLNAASTLVAHGCLDHVVMIVGEAGAEQECLPATNLLTQSVLAADLNPERNELAAMKFLLSAGCRNLRENSTNSNAMLGGSHLLQTIRMLYHIFLTTESTPNKITARAALQQLVTHVFGRMAAADADAESDGELTSTDDGFPSDHHRNAFLVLRAICKLSMRSLPDAASGMHSHIGFQSSGSNETWDGVQRGGSQHGPSSPTTIAVNYDSGLSGEGREHAQLIYTSAIHPALESKILALDLLHYVLTHVEFSTGFVQRSGPQFHAAIRNYLCVSLLKNCTSAETHVVNLSLRIFVPTVRHFRTLLKTEIEAFVTNVFFVILDSPNSSADHKGIVVRTFEEICSDPRTLAEIFLNYDCDLSAVDLFHRIVQTLSRVSRTGLQPDTDTGSSMFGSSAARLEKARFETRELRLDAMKAMRQVLASLHASIVEPMDSDNRRAPPPPAYPDTVTRSDSSASSPPLSPSSSTVGANPVEVYGSKKKRRAEQAEAVLRFNQKPSAGIAFAAQCGHLNGDDPADVARYLLAGGTQLHGSLALDKTLIGEYLGREAEYQDGFSLRVLHEYVRLLDFSGETQFDNAIRHFLSGFRLPGEAQKIDRIMEKFAERFTEQNPGLFPSADVAFILSFSIIMLNTDLHNPAIKEERRMTKEGFVRNNRGICDGQDLPQELLFSIFDRIKENPISLKEDDEARERAGGGAKGAVNGGNIQAAMNPASFFTSHYDEMDRARESNFRKERDHIVRTTESLLKQRRRSHHTDGPGPASPSPTGGKTLSPSSPASSNKGRSPKSHHSRTAAHQRFVRTEDSGLRDEYVAPMFEVTWGPALAAFSTAIESANGTMGSLLAIATDEELEIAAENAAETIEVCLTGFRFAICTGGLVGADVARDSYMLALARFSQLGTGTLLEPRHVRCIQTLLSLAREDGELLGTSWQHVFRALSEVNRFHQLFQNMARNDRAAAAAAERRRKRLEERDARRRAREQRRKRQAEDSSTAGESSSYDSDLDDASASDIGSLAESDIFDDVDEEFLEEEDMDAKAIDEANARLVYDGVSEDVIEVIYERSSSLSTPAIKVFVLQLCHVSSMEISVGSGSGKDLNYVAYRQQHALLANSSHGPGTGGDQFHHSQPNIYNLQKLVEVAHYNMESRPRLIFAELWSTIASHLTQTSLHKNPALAMYAVDSFRQLSIQFLKREELEVFEFQKRFLKPLETVMGKSQQSSTKELLLNCVARIIQVFDGGSEEAAVTAKGGLKSGWVPLLVILGLGGQDEDRVIAEMSDEILLGLIHQNTKAKAERPASVLLIEHFAETVDSVFMCMSGPHTDLSTQLLKVCPLLAQYLAEERPVAHKRASSAAAATAAAATVAAGDEEPQNQDKPEQQQQDDLELWWPLLLGISRATGEGNVDTDFRLEALEILFAIINNHFFPTNTSVDVADNAIQRIQLVFRGILTPMLEFAELGSNRAPRLPKDFERFLTSAREKSSDEEEAAVPSSWLEALFDPFTDACIALCKRCVDVYCSKAKDDKATADSAFLIMEEVFAILNHCLVSDSGALAVRGIDRLEQFVTSDLDSHLVTENVWATVCHMLRKCLSVRVPKKKKRSMDPPTEADKKSGIEEDYELEDVREFVAEESLLMDRRYVGSNAVAVIGNMLSSERLASDMGFRWSLFLIAGLGRGIGAWEEAASLLRAQQKQQKPRALVMDDGPPDYLETAYYGRHWMNRFLIQLASMEQVAQAAAAEAAGTELDDMDPSSRLYRTAKKLVLEETERLLVAFVDQEMAYGERATGLDAALQLRLAKLAQQLISGYTNMRHDHIVHMSWLNPVLLSSCLQSKNEHVLAGIQKFVNLTETPLVAEASPVEEAGKADDEAKADEQAGEADGEAKAENEEKAEVVKSDPPSATTSGADSGAKEGDNMQESPSDEEFYTVTSADTDGAEGNDASPDESTAPRVQSADI